MIKSQTSLFTACGGNTMGSKWWRKTKIEFKRER